MNEDNPQDQSAPASNDAVPSTEAAEVAAQSATDAAADNATPAPATPASAAPAPVTPASAAPAPAAPVHGHEMPSTFASQAPAAPVIAPVPQGYAAPAATAPATATAQGAAFGIPTASSYTQPTQPLDGGAGLPGEGTKTKEQKPRSGAKFAAFIVAAALVGGVAGFGGGALLNGLQDQPSSGTATGPQTVTVNNPGSVNETTAVATAALPSVVTIEVAGSDQAGSGSGVIISDDGYVLTNTHVVTLGGAVADPTIRVTTSDGRIFEATVVGTDPIYDLAVIKLKDAKGLTPIDFADSSKLNVGDTAVALGAPLGLANSVTTGIVSALNRSIQIASSALPDSSSEDAPNQQQTPDQGQGPFQFDIPGSGTPQTSDSISIAVIQTDAAINHGNSGGALVNSKGELIGINVAIASSGSSEESGSIGIGFAIPSNIAKRVSDEIIADGAATHGLLGASVQDASSVQGATVSGAYIAKATDGGAAAAAGIQEGDVVTTFNGVPITSASDLTAQVRAAAAGSDAKVTYVRAGKQYDVEVKLGELAG
ncbi:trypsin-like peptidase domain-containing protein [uncultured Microbacterium sp.]|uniref:S1C family serine protease n=1 Tax=uncultured Microbacterium sp. TaxID=191216 RepID=UPI0028EA51F2|nr:trypsin-like peptidase domain-containing protein [uncultured Microbacterium sp.]